MREILFRGKRLDNGEWVFGMLGQYHDGIKATIIENHLGVFENTVELVCVAPETVGQYTGLKDKNGKRIFEGDICKMKICDYQAESLFIISIRNACVGFSPINAGKCHPDDRKWKSFWKNEEQDMWDTDYFLIIGNIHDNPELLEGGAK